MLVPKKALQVVVPRPGVAADVQIGLVGGGDIEGALMKSGELGFEGVDLELVDPAGKVVATARTDFDGFFLFERVAYGRYTLRVAARPPQRPRSRRPRRAARSHAGKAGRAARRDPAVALPQIAAAAADSAAHLDNELGN